MLKVESLHYSGCWKLSAQLLSYTTAEYRLDLPKFQLAQGSIIRIIESKVIQLVSGLWSLKTVFTEMEK